MKKKRVTLLLAFLALSGGAIAYASQGSESGDPNICTDPFYDHRLIHYILWIFYDYEDHSHSTSDPLAGWDTVDYHLDNHHPHSDEREAYTMDVLPSGYHSACH